MNIIQQAEQLKDISDDRIAQEMRKPTGVFPLYLVSSEAKRRADLRQRFKTDQVEAPQTTVQQDLLTALAGQAQPPAIPGAAQQQGAPGAQPLPPRATPPMPQAPPRMAPQMPPQAAPQMPPRMPPQIPPGNLGVGNVPTRGFAEGGTVRGSQNGSGGYLPVDLDRLSLIQRLRRNKILGQQPSVDVSSSAPSSSPFNEIRTENLKSHDVYGSEGLDLARSLPFLNKTYGGPGRPHQPSRYADEFVAPERFDIGEEAKNLVGGAPRDEVRELAPPQAPAPAPPALPEVAFPPRPASGGAAFPPAPTFAAPGGAAGAGVKPLGDFTQLMDAREAKITASRGDPYKKFADIMAARAEAVGDAETRNKWLAVARAGFEMAGGQSQYALTNIGKGLGEGLTEYTKGQTAIDARRDKNLALDMQLTGVQEKLKSEISTIAMAQANGQINAQTANAQIAQKQAQLNDARVVEQNRNAERLAQYGFKKAEFLQRGAERSAQYDQKKAEFLQRADLKREGIASRERIAKAKAEAGGPFYKDYAAIEKNIKDPVKRAAAHRAYIETRRGASPMRITRSHVAAMTNKLNKRTAALMANRGTLMISEPVLETLRNTKIGESTVYEIISGTVKSTSAEKKKAENHVKAWAQSEHMNDPQFLEMLDQRLILRPGASQAQKGWGAVRQKSKQAAP